ncbi:hypothetical protein GCM10010911_52400 [Paenibacillus nasutitermitis]|uniref:Glycosyltransferase n=2 Tax=Paenibacillus nasutitermitis TaxID=1652958 RepID=A0A917E020_9BACL|nr:hypothetical protein GCM10010911_52400 [Paenibacillus nasutitermitis]
MYEYGLDLVPYGTSYIRLLLPFKHKSNELITVTSGTDIDDLASDVYIVERLWRPDINLNMAENLIKRIKRARKKLIYTLDDNLLDLAFNRGGAIWPTNEQKNIIRLFAKEADGVIVSTVPLKERFDKFNKKVIVVENAIDDKLQGVEMVRKDQPSDEVVFGYMGTPSHEADLKMILPAIREVLTKNDNVRFEIIGVMEQQYINKVFGNLNVKLLNTTGNVEYPKFRKWMGNTVNWDFALAPLEENRFSKCKSDIKVLDYGILKIPGIYSDVSIYRENVRHLQNGYLTNNDNEHWFEAVEFMIRNKDVRDRLADNVYKYTKTNRTLDVSAHRWGEAVRQIVN